MIFFFDNFYLRFVIPKLPSTSDSEKTWHTSDSKLTK